MAAMNDTKRQDTSSRVDALCACISKLASQFGELKEEIKKNAGTPRGEALKKFLNQIIAPETKAWMYVTGMIESAQAEPDISINPEAMKFLSIMKTLSSAAWGGLKLADVLRPLVDQVTSEKASSAATKKNEAPRVWVLTKWENRTEKVQSKAAFSRQYAPLVKKQFDLIVNPETIARDWLPKTKK